GDLEALVPEMVELKDERIVFAAISAWMLAEVFEQVSRSGLGTRSFPTSFCVDVPLAVRQIVLAPISLPAWAAHIAALSPVPSAPGELSNRLRLPAPATLSHSIHSNICSQRPRMDRTGCPIGLRNSPLAGWFYRQGRPAGSPLSRMLLPQSPRLTHARAWAM